MKAQSKKVRVQPYDVNVTYTTDLKKFLALSKMGLTSKIADCDGYAGFTDAGRKGGWVIGVFDSDLATLVHESVHAAAFILIDVGIELEMNQSEPMAYLVDYLYREGSKFMKQISDREAVALATHLSSNQVPSCEPSAIDNSSTY